MAKINRKDKQFISSKDVGIARRLRDARIRLNLSQFDAARQLGISRERLASYEELRAPLRFDIALRFCWQFVFSEEWLALGQDEILARWDKKSPGRHEWVPFRARLCMSLLFDPVIHKIKPGMLFIDAYNDYLAPVYDKLSAGQFAPRIAFSGAMDDHQIKNYYHALMEWWMQSANTPLKQFRFLTSLAYEAWQIQNGIESDDLTEYERDRIIQDGLKTGRLPDNPPPDDKAIEDFVLSQKPHFLANFSSVFNGPLKKRYYRQSGAEETLDKGGPPNDAALVTGITSLADLIKELRQLTKARGMKSQLAKECNVSRQAVNQWLAGDSKPSAEAVFAALKWVIGKRNHK